LGGNSKTSLGLAVGFAWLAFGKAVRELQGSEPSF
jgi:hypothetical protein